MCKIELTYASTAYYYALSIGCLALGQHGGIGDLNLEHPQYKKGNIVGGGGGNHKM